MHALWKFRPDLHACELEDRLVPVIPNLSVIVLTTGGYVLMIPFPGAATSPGGSPGGTAIPSSFVMTGSGGISGVQPGNIAGVSGPAATGTTGSNGGTGLTPAVGSGGNDANAPNIPLVTRNTIANDALVPLPLIGRVSGDRSSVLPAGQLYWGGFPVTAPDGVLPEVPEEQAGQIPRPRPVDASSIRLGIAPHQLPLDASANPVKTIEDRVP
jgi:hypothetical protein